MWTESMPDAEPSPDAAPALAALAPTPANSPQLTLIVHPRGARCARFALAVTSPVADH
jgi:hypothetical protein